MALALCLATLGPLLMLLLPELPRAPLRRRYVEARRRAYAAALDPQAIALEALAEIRAFLCAHPHPQAVIVTHRQLAEPTGVRVDLVEEVEALRQSVQRTDPARVRVEPLLAYSRFAPFLRPQDAFEIRIAERGEALLAKIRTFR